MPLKAPAAPRTTPLTILMLNLQVARSEQVPDSLGETSYVGALVPQPTAFRRAELAFK
jgi:hypothetical protein